MTRNGQRALTVLLLVATIALVVRATRGQPRLGEWRPAAPCDVPVEMVGSGVRCLRPDEARARSVAPGDRVEANGTRGRMAPVRLALFDVPLDPNVASAAELASLPGVGPRLSEAIVAARPYATVEQVGLVKGLGGARFAAIRGRLAVAAPGRPTAASPAGGP